MRIRIDLVGGRCVVVLREGQNLVIWETIGWRMREAYKIRDLNWFVDVIFVVERLVISSLYAYSPMGS